MRMLNKKLEQRADGKYKLIESFIIKPSQIRKLSLNESKQSNINYNGKKYKAIAIYTMPVSIPDRKNMNERIYTTKLWENVIRKQMCEGCYSLCGNPENDGNPADAWAVTYNLRFNENKSLILADFYLYGPLGRQANEGIEAGGEIGLSTSGWGDFEEDGFTIKESTYELERIADWVLESSFGLFGNMDDQIFTESKLYESVNKKRKTKTLIEKVLNSRPGWS